MTTYSKLLYPETAEGEGYTSLPVPETFGDMYATSPNWNPYSANEADRTEYWEDSEGILTLADVQEAMWGIEGLRDIQINKLTQNYGAIVATDVTYTTIAGVTAVFQADNGSMMALVYTLAGTSFAKLTPPGFWWQDIANVRIPFTYEDLHRLAAAMFDKGGPAFQHLQTRKQEVRDALTAVDVQAIDW